ncbi:signal recognition particle receptor subunit beta [Aplysia californica]|uniref:Signal recognition particle receptor subunit beta n=1 Tax=Aplysia californica TaxID=6500 RepID=A0ABM0JHV6_APLCA|nr:signal recognition particle receptor subunit beta [Aplysia californica]
MAGASELVETVVQGIERQDPAILGVLIAIIVGFITVLILIVKSRSQNKRQGVLLLGICDAGKTLIFSRLVHKGFKETYTSIKANSGEYAVPEKNKNLRVIDLPGHERIRGQLLDEFKSLARGIVFVVDSGTLQKEVKEVAEYLYMLLSDRTVSSNAPPILILCNKQDLTLSKGAKVIRKQLEKEMNTLRITRAAALQGVGDTANNNAYLGKRDKDFDFADLKPLKVDFAECSALGEGKSTDNPQMDDFYSWISNIA